MFAPSGRPFLSPISFGRTKESTPTAVREPQLQFITRQSRPQGATNNKLTHPEPHAFPFHLIQLPVISGEPVRR